MSHFAAAQLAAVQFTPVRVSTSRTAGYETDAVDALLASCRAALESWERGEPAALTASDVVGSRLTPGAGYSADEVDDLLDRVTMQLAAYESAAGTPVEPIRSFEISTVRIPQRRVGGRFAIEDVDRFLDEASAALRCWEGGTPASLHADDIVHREFKSVALFGLGYDADFVDDLFDRIAAQLRTYEPKTQLSSAQERQDEQQVRGMLAKAEQELREKRGEA